MPKFDLEEIQRRMDAIRAHVPERLRTICETQAGPIDRKTYHQRKLEERRASMAKLRQEVGL